MRAADVVEALRRHYGCEGDGMGPEWAALTEFTLQPAGQCRIDLMMVRAWSGRPKGHERHAIEVKVSRSDLLKELARPEKRAPFEAVVHRFWFATPAGLTTPAELPAEVGLYEATSRGVRIVRRAPMRDPAPMPEKALVEAFRRASRAEARIRDAARADDLPARAAELERTVASLTRAVASRDAALGRERGRVKALLDVVASTAVCACGASLTAKVGDGWPHVQWRHHEQAPDCQWPVLDVEATMAARETQQPV